MGFFTVFFWTNYPTPPFPGRWYHSSIQYVRPEISTLYLTAWHPSEVPLCQDNVIHHLEDSRSGIRGVFSTSAPWRTRFRSALCEQTRRTSAVPPRRGWTPPTLQYSHNGTLRGLPCSQPGGGERGSEGITPPDLCLLRCLCKALLVDDHPWDQAAEQWHCGNGEAGAGTLLMVVLLVEQGARWEHGKAPALTHTMRPHQSRVHQRAQGFALPLHMPHLDR